MIHTIILSSSSNNNNKCDQINIYTFRWINPLKYSSCYLMHQLMLIFFEGEENDGVSLCFLQYFHFALSEMASVAVMSSGLSQWESAFHLSGNVFSYLIWKEARLISNSMDFLSLLNENSSQCTFLLCPWLPMLSLCSHPLHRLQIKCVSDYFFALKKTVEMSMESFVFSTTTQVHYS